jgi:hypothetical protein
MRDIDDVVQETAKPPERRVAGLWPTSSLTATNARIAVEPFTGQRTFEAHLAYRELIVLSHWGTELCRDAGIA